MKPPYEITTIVNLKSPCCGAPVTLWTMTEGPHKGDKAFYCMGCRKKVDTPLPEKEAA